MKRTRKQKKGGITIGFIVKLVMALVILGLLLCIIAGRGPLCQNSIREQMKNLLSSLAGKPTEDPGCVPYHQIDSYDNLSDLVSLAATGQCGGDTSQSAFLFNISDAGGIGMSVKAPTDTTSDYFCGTHTYEVNGLNRTITFGDVEKVESDNCGYNGEPFWEFWESQACVANNNNDLVIVAPAGSMETTQCIFPAHMDDYPSGVPYVGCYIEGGSWGASHLKEIGLDSNNQRGNWYIKRAGEDTVLCFITKEKEIELGLRAE